MINVCETNRCKFRTSMRVMPE